MSFKMLKHRLQRKIQGFYCFFATTRKILIYIYVLDLILLHWYSDIYFVYLIDSDNIFYLYQFIPNDNIKKINIYTFFINKRGV